MATDEPEVITLEDRINALEVELARLRETPGTLGWPNVPTIAQGFAAHRWQRRDGATPAEGLPPTYVSEAPADGYYYGRVNYTWQQVVEEAPELTSRRSDTGWARASFGSAVPWISLDDVLAPYLTDAPADQYTWGRRNGNWQQLEQVFASTNSPQFLGTPSAPTAPPADNSLQIANTTFVTDAIAAGSGGIPDVPATSGAYARFRSGGTTDWMDFGALRVASLDSPQFAGAPTAPTVGAGSNSDAIATTQWIQNQFNVRDFLSRNGGSMIGPLITIPGSGPTSPGIGIGDNSTGFYRPGPGLLNASVSGVNVSQFMTAVCAFFVPINVGNNVIQAVGDPANATDALNVRTGDSRYLQQSGGFITGALQLLFTPAVPNDATNKGYVDNAIGAVATPTTLRTQAFEPNQVVIPSPTANVVIFDQNVDVPAVGLRYLLVTVDPLFACDQPATNPWSLVYACLLSPPGVEVPVLAFKIGNGTTDFLRSPVSFRVVVDATPGSIRVQLVVRTDTVNPPLTQLGANSTIASMHTVVTVTDLGPVGGSENAEEAQPSRAGRRQRSATRSDHRRPA